MGQRLENYLVIVVESVTNEEIILSFTEHGPTNELWRFFVGDMKKKFGPDQSLSI